MPCSPERCPCSGAMVMQISHSFSVVKYRSVTPLAFVLQCYKKDLYKTCFVVTMFIPYFSSYQELQH